MQTKKKIRFSDIANLVVNKRTRQYSLNLKKKQLCKFGLTPKKMMKLVFTKGAEIKW